MQVVQVNKSNASHLSKVCHSSRTSCHFCAAFVCFCCPLKEHRQHDGSPRFGPEANLFNRKLLKDKTHTRIVKTMCQINIQVLKQSNWEFEVPSCSPTPEVLFIPSDRGNGEVLFGPGTQILACRKRHTVIRTTKY